MENSELDRLMAEIGKRYTVDVVPLKIGDKVLKILQIKDLEDYLAQLIELKSAGFKDLPYWSKLWDASFMLAYFLGKQQVVLGRKMLEIGAGLGIVGIYAALCGHQVTITDIDDDALRFAKINALLNGLPALKVRKLDWNDPGFDEQYDVIVGSEVVYDRETYPVLVQFLRRALAPGGIIFLAKDATLQTPTFFEQLTRYFEFKQTTQAMRLDGESREIVLYAIRSKENRTVN